MGKLRQKIIFCIILILIFLMNILPNKVMAQEVKQELKSGIDAFPKSYQTYLNNLKKLHPSWNFEAYYTGIDWNELIRNETGEVLHKRSVVPVSKPDSWKCSTCKPYNGWVCASKSAVEYFIDPRNFLDEIRIFQFEELSYNEKVHTLDSIKNSVKGTFLANSVTYYDEETKKNVTKSYSEIILEVAKKTNMSPFHIKSKIIQEVGSSGSGSVSGTYRGYEGLYNFFNYGAHDTGDPIANGLEFARQKGWTNPYKAILGGAELIGNSYINVGQNTSYFFKFDVVGGSILQTGKSQTVNTSSFFAHQYMTNIMDPYSQSASVYNMYAANGNLDANLNFIIPVYNNMPNEVIEETKKQEQQVVVDESAKIAKVTPTTTVETIVKNLNATNYNMVDASGKAIEKKNEKVATGYKINVLKSDNKTVEKTYTLVLVGDADGDGKVLATDALAILKHSINKSKLKDIYSKAADINKDGKVLATDALETLKYSIGKITITIK